jgi:hypothetical protein
LVCGERWKIGRNVRASFPVRNCFAHYDPEGRKSRRGVARQGWIGIAGLDRGNGLWVLSTPAGRWGEELAAERVVRRSGKENEEVGREW